MSSCMVLRRAARAPSRSGCALVADARNERCAGEDRGFLFGELGGGGRWHHHAALAFEAGERVVDTERRLTLKELGVGGHTVGVLVPGAGRVTALPTQDPVVPFIGVVVAETS
jgi:hypothetical protein